jgi:membrane protease YdiL (CAAX protease family)
MLPYIRTGYALGHARTGTVCLMPTPRRWSLLVPLLGLALAVLLLPAATARWVPFEFRAALGYLVVWVPLSAAVVVAVLLWRRDSDEPWWLRIGVRWSGTVMLVGVFVGLFARSVAFVIELLVTGRISGGSVGLDGSTSDLTGVVALIVASAIVGPVIEETFFRGVLQPALIERSGGSAAASWIGIVGTAAIFAAVHAVAGASALGAAITFVAGLGFGLVARTSGLVAAVVAHAVFNASGLALLLANTPVSPLRPTLGLG